MTTQNTIPEKINKEQQQIHTTVCIYPIHTEELDEYIERAVDGEQNELL